MKKLAFSPRTGRLLRGLCLVFALALLAGTVGSCARARHVRPGVQLYLAHNLWDAGSAGEIRSINFKTGTMIPAGTPISQASIKGDWLRFIVNGRWHRVLLIRKYHPGVSIHTIASRLFTDKTFEELTREFTTEEVQFIRAGDIGIGMSKSAVVVSQGYPPEHQTRSLAENEWVYYRHRLASIRVTFDGANRVAEVRR